VNRPTSARPFPPPADSVDEHETPCFISTQRVVAVFIERVGQHTVGPFKHTADGFQESHSRTPIVVGMIHYTSCLTSP
jgi:hypothetical protein